MIEDGWFLCDNCGRKLLKVEYGAMARGIAIKCRGTDNNPCGKVSHIVIGIRDSCIPIQYVVECEQVNNAEAESR